MSRSCASSGVDSVTSGTFTLALAAMPSTAFATFAYTMIATRTTFSLSASLSLASFATFMGHAHVAVFHGSLSHNTSPTTATWPRGPS
jgi:hypothetical protein